jgi:hypothetical protein
MGLPDAVLERGRQADAPVNDGQFVRRELSLNLLGCGALRPGGIEMRKQIVIRRSVKVDVAACLRAIAAIIYL